jgi:hypothetical protein
MMIESDSGVRSSNHPASSSTVSFSLDRVEMGQAGVKPQIGSDSLYDQWHDAHGNHKAVGLLES